MRTLVLDTETTALVANSLLAEHHLPQIIEFCGLVYDEEARLVDELEFFCDPGRTIPAEVTKITGIKTEDVKGHPSFGHRAMEVRRLIESCDAVVAHNLSYDMTVVDVEMRRLEKAVNWPTDQVCTVEQTEHLKGHRLRLGDLHELLFGEPFAGAHRARVDVEALARCYHELVRRGEI